jgi:hypothetical protein
LKSFSTCSTTSNTARAVTSSPLPTGDGTLGEATASQFAT